MIGDRLKDKSWLLKNGLCMLWALAPIFGWFGFVIMGKRSGRKQLTTLGRVYGILALGCYIGYSLNDCLTWLAYRPSGTIQWLATLNSALTEMSLLILIGMWFVCLIHTLCSAKQYFRYLALRQESQPQPEPLPEQKGWAFREQLWVALGCVPFVGGLALHYAGGTVGNKNWKKAGLISLIIGIVLYLCMFLLPERSYLLGRYVGGMAWNLMYILTLLTFLAAILIRPQWLQERVKLWNRDTRKQPNLAQRKWCRRNSRWQLWTCVPYFGGVGIVLAGNGARSRALMARGCVLLALSGASVVLTALLDTRAGGLGYYLPYAVRETINYLLGLAPTALWIGSVYYGCLIRWEALRLRAGALMGYEDEFQRDLDLHTRQTRARKPEAQPKEQIVPAVPETKGEAQPELHTRLDIPDTTITQTAVEEKAPAGLIDINRCTQAELLTLPGVGIVQAKAAMQYRQEHGSFRSVEEFTEVLELKPHFAVQVFERATVAAPAAPEKKPVTGTTGRRRRLDF